MQAEIIKTRPVILNFCCFLGSFAIDDTEIPLEFSAFYSIDGELFDMELAGVTMVASRSNYTGGKYVNGQKNCV